MTVKITDEMLMMVRGSAFNTLENVRSVRIILAKAGVTDVELHPLEVEAIRDLRKRAEVATRSANAMEAGGPYPEPELEQEETT